MAKNNPVRNRERAKQWHIDNRERALDHKRNFYIANKEHHDKQNAEWRADNPDKMKIYKLRARLKRCGVTVEEYERAVEEQQGICAICGVEDPRGLQVDHCHKVNRFRGLLCGNCNKALGLIRDNPTIAEAMVLYLRTHAPHPKERTI